MLPLLFIQILFEFWAPVATPPAPVARGASNISANGLPNCNKSSEALVVPAAAVEPVPGCAEAAPNKSTIGWPAAEAGGDDKNGFVNAALAAAPPLVGEETLCCFLFKKKEN